MVPLSNALFLLAFFLFPSTALADAILPSLVLVWPIMALLFIPIVVIESLYAKTRLRIGFWEITRITTVSNFLSTIAGLPVAHLLSAGLKYALESLRFRNVSALRTEASALHLVDPSRLGLHDTMALMWLGLYPRWIMIVSASAMMIVCFLVSWWIEGKWLQIHQQNRS
jgi:hypothetical protein